jgi:serine/threonine-protein kinase
MPEWKDLLVSKPISARGRMLETAGSPSLDLRPRSVRRLQLVSLVLLVVSLTLWLVSNLVRGNLRAELGNPWQWAPPTLTVVASLLIYLITRRPDLSPARIIRAGLTYEVAISFAITFGSSYGAYWGIPAAEMEFDRIGMSWVIPWTLFFTVLVQAPVKEAVIALVASSAAPAIGYLVELSGHRAPVVPPADFFVLFVLPYAVGASMTYIAALVVHELGQDVQRARELGSYRLESRLGQGGMGEVWRASHHTLARPAAIKIIRADALDSEPALAQQAAIRFEREAQAIASLQSRHTVQLYDFGMTQAGTLYYVMELLDGMDLEEIVRRDGPMPAARVVHILVQACASLSEAHRRGVIHRDVKPANIYLCREAFECDVVKILDFGLAKRIVSDAAPGSGRDTRTDVIMGTPAYLAPEAIHADAALDGRADIYALGCVAYWLLTGRLVFESESAMGMMAAHLERTPSPPGVSAPFPVPAALDQLILRCLAKRPEGRPPTADALASELTVVRAELPWTARDAAEGWERRALAASS